MTARREIKAQLVDQFGPAVLAEPPKRGFDLLAWLLPLGALAVGAVVVGALAWTWSRRRDGAAEPERDRARPRPRAAGGRGARPVRGVTRCGRPSLSSRSSRDSSRSSRPCVLPLVPGYLSAVSAVEADRLGDRGSARRVVLASIPFVLGFTAVFVALGVGAQLIGAGLFRDQFLLERVAGFVLVVFGLAFMGLLPWPERLVGAGLVQGARSRGSRVLLGGAFAICAAPCIGPVLAAILVLAGTSDTRLPGRVSARVLLARAGDPVRPRRCDLHAGDGSVPLAARPLRRDPVRQRGDHGGARAAALLRALLRPPDLPQPRPRAPRDRRILC